jgi:uncharacterized protein (DUF433 family)
MEQELLKRITILPGLMGGRTTIRGMRFPAKDILELLSSGMSQTQILEQHPAVEEDDIKATLLFASIKLGNTNIFYSSK